MYFTKDLYFTLWFIDKLNRYLKMVVNTVCAEVCACDNFRDNATMSRSRKIVVVTLSLIVRKLSRCRCREEKLSLIFATLDSQMVCGGGGLWVAGGGFGWRVMGGRWREVGGGWRVVVDGGSSTPPFPCAVQYSL